jgi:hypothetical protein
VQARTWRRRRRASGEKPMHHGINTGVAKGKGLLSWGENYHCYVNSTKRAKFTSLLEKTGSSLREGDLQMTFLGYFFNLNLLATHGRLFVHHCKNLLIYQRRTNIRTNTKCLVGKLYLGYLYGKTFLPSSSL